MKKIPKKIVEQEEKNSGTSDLKNAISKTFPIVGIGASAGGLEALEQFFTNMPKDTGMAFVVIQHLDPNHIGIMPELLQRITGMKVNQVTDNLKVKPNHVYVIPPNKSMSILMALCICLNQLKTGITAYQSIVFSDHWQRNRRKKV